MSDKPLFYTVKEVCEILKVKPLTVYRWLKNNKLQAVKIGKSFRIEKSEFDKFVSVKSSK